MNSNDIFRKLSRGIKLKKLKRNQMTIEKSKSDYLNNAEISNKRKAVDEPINNKRINLEIDEDKTVLEEFEPEKKKKKKSKELRLQVEAEQINHIRNKFDIHVYGYDIADPISTFNDLKTKYGVNEIIVKNIEKMNFLGPTPVEMQGIPILLQRRETMICAPTGSGKTLTFVIPILHTLKQTSSNGLRALVIVPTKELSKQIYKVFMKTGKKLGFNIQLIKRSSKNHRSIWLQSDIVITTPRKLVFALKKYKKSVKLNSVEWLIIDESDKLFEDSDFGFREQLGIIYKECSNANIRRAMFSATFSHEVENWCQLNLDNVIQVYIGSINSASKSIEQELVYTGDEAGKLLAIRQILKQGHKPPILVFVQSKMRAQQLFKELVLDGLSVDAIHSDKSEAQRNSVMQMFERGQTLILICTELLSRGIDFKEVNLVINYDFPNSAISYIHRIGRTGRAGKVGKAITFFTAKDTILLRSIANLVQQAGCEVPKYMLQMKLANKKLKKKLAKSVPKRKCISI